MRRWYVTLEIQMAMDADGNLTKNELEDKLTKAQVEFKYDNQLEPYPPDQVDVTYLEVQDAAQ